VVSVGRQIFVVAFRNGGWTRDRTYDLSAVITEDDQLNSALPDWSGRLWFVTRRQGIVGVLDPKSGRVLGTHRTGEAIGNSFAMDETGGVFVVTDKVQYRFDAGRAGAPKVSWRVRYDNVGIKKPGQFDAGSGTTPTLMGRRYLSITDNADPMQVVVMQRAKRLARGQRRVVCERTVFRKGASATENSIIATGRSMIVENNYGYFPPPDATSGREHDRARGRAGRHRPRRQGFAAPSGAAARSPRAPSRSCRSRAGSSTSTRSPGAPPTPGI
jgi:hypothetical protein